MKYILLQAIVNFFCKYFYTGTWHFISAEWIYDPNGQTFHLIEAAEVFIIEKKNIYRSATQDVSYIHRIYFHCQTVRIQYNRFKFINLISI